MKIGIITFHWASNYGALLQSYALQQFFINNGHDAEIINYKPHKYDFNYKYYITHPWKIKELFKVDLPLKAIEKKIASFRDSKLRQTKRFYSYEELVQANFDYDVYVSGSDQILNPSFTLFGEGKPTSAYYLGFAPENMCRIGYAVSFGCTEYPEPAKQHAIQWIKNFDHIGVRENSGLNILNSLHSTVPVAVVPDPTLLLGKDIFNDCNLHEDKSNGEYYYVHVLRSRNLDFKDIDTTKCIEGEKLGALSIPSWLNYIYNSKALITNSYHAMIMAILMHRKFVVIMESGFFSGMNDRFYTLLSRLGLENRIVANNADAIRDVIGSEIDWTDVDNKIKEFRAVGETFLAEILNRNMNKSL